MVWRELLNFYKFQTIIKKDQHHIALQDYLLGRRLIRVIFEKIDSAWGTSPTHIQIAEGVRDLSNLKPWRMAAMLKNEAEPSSKKSSTLSLLFTKSMSAIEAATVPARILLISYHTNSTILKTSTTN